MYHGPHLYLRQKFFLLDGLLHTRRSSNFFYFQSGTSVRSCTQDHFYSISATLDLVRFSDSLALGSGLGNLTTLDHEISIHHTIPCNWTTGQVDEAYSLPLDAIFLCVRFPHSGLGSWWCYHLCRPECKTFWRFPSV